LAAFGQPAVAGGQRVDLRLADHGHGGEVEGVERLGHRQPRLDQVAFDAPAVAIGHLQLGQGGQEAGRRPGLAIGLLGQLGPQPADGGQAQLAQQQLQPGGVDGVGAAHSGAPVCTAHSATTGAISDGSSLS
jgi:hypothetical protein